MISKKPYKPGKKVDPVKIKLDILEQQLNQLRKDFQTFATHTALERDELKRAVMKRNLE